MPNVSPSGSSGERVPNRTVARRAIGSALLDRNGRSERLPHPTGSSFRAVGGREAVTPAGVSTRQIVPAGFPQLMPERPRPQGPDTPTEILLVEDEPGDIRLIEEAFETTEREVTVHTVSNGYDAIHFLKRRTSSGSPSLPNLALVNLNVPGKDGCEILETIRDDPQLRRLPVIMLTTSNDRSDIARCYDALANAYITKPTDTGEFVSLAEAIERFWFERVQFPPS